MTDLISNLCLCVLELNLTFITLSFQSLFSETSGCQMNFGIQSFCLILETSDDELSSWWCLEQHPLEKHTSNSAAKHVKKINSLI